MWHHYFQRASLRAGFGAHRAGSVFLFVAKQRHPVAACVLPVLRRPAHHRGVASASALHGKNSSTGVCSSAQSRKSLACRASNASSFTVASQQQTNPRGSGYTSFRQQSWGSCFRRQMPKSGKPQHRCARRPAQQSSPAAIHPQCTPNQSLNRTFCGVPRLG